MRVSAHLGANLGANLGARQAAAVYDALDGDSTRFFADCLQVGADEAGCEVCDGLGRGGSVRREGGRVSGAKCGTPQRIYLQVKRALRAQL